MQYSSLASVFEALSATSSRLEKTSILASFLQKQQVEDLEAVLLLLQGKVFSDWEEHKLGVAGKLVFKSLATATGHTEEKIKDIFTELGDIGETAKKATAQKKQQTLFSTPLTLSHVFATLQKIAKQEGTGSQDTKLALLNSLLTSASPVEAKFIVRTVVEDLRVGVASSTFRDATYYAFYTKDFTLDENNQLQFTEKEGYPKEETIKAIQRAYDFTADFATVIRHILSGDNLSTITLQIGKPCKAMLARKEKTFAEAFARTGFPVRLEYKYDGFRMQIHKDGSDVHLFTRRLDEVTTQFPDIVVAVQKHVKAVRCILDAEAIGYEKETGKYMPFQHVSRRIKRKHNIQELVRELPVSVSVFDVLSLNGELLLDTPLHERLKRLEQNIKPQKRVIEFVDGITIKKEEEAQAFYEKSLAAGNEGVMIKDLHAPYQPGGRVSAWIKMKPTMDELDLVIVGAEWGNGKRSKWLTSFTLACQNDDGDFFEVGKVGTGMKEEEGEAVSFPQLTKLLEPLIIAKNQKSVRVQPEVVVEIAYEEIQKSPSYSSGYALRFPRVLRLREDRSATDIASFDDILDLYDAQ